MKRHLTETDVCMKLITPALQRAGWDLQSQIFRETPLNELTKGRVYVRGQLHQRGKARRADYILVFNNIPLAVIEAKTNELPLGAGMQQALDYAGMLDLLFAYSSNGEGFLEHDATMANGLLERELSLDQFPSPQELWNRYTHHKGIAAPEAESLVAQPYLDHARQPAQRVYRALYR